MKKQTGRNLAALLLAGDRRADDALVRTSDAPCKSLAPVAGVPMILRVIEALRTTGRITSWALCGPPPAAIAGCPPLRRFIDQENVVWLPAGKNLGDSVQAALEKIDSASMTLITTADHALLDAAILNCFLERVDNSRAQAHAGLVRYELIRALYPETRRTVLRFSDGEYCGCNLYAVSGAGGRDIVSYWRRVEASRKKPWQMIAGLLGAGALLRYSCGLLSLGQARRAISKATDIEVDFIELPFAHAGIDVDTPEDRELAEKILAAR